MVMSPSLKGQFLGDLTINFKSVFFFLQTQDGGPDQLHPDVPLPLLLEVEHTYREQTDLS